MKQAVDLRSRGRLDSYSELAPGLAARAFGGIEWRDSVDLNLQYLGKARVSPALCFL